MWFYTGYFMDDQAQNFLMTQTCGWSLEHHDESSVPMVANPRYSCRSVPKQVCWWHHQIGHLPCCPCSLSGWQLAERGRPVALLSGCVRYSRLPTGMSALLPPTGEREATHHYLSLLISTLSLWQKLNCIPASTPKLFGRHCILFFAFCLHKIMEPQTWHSGEN